MADVTDAAFRRIIAKYGKPDVTWTEFVSADGLCHPKGREKLLKDLEYSESERPIVAQLFSSRPENMRAAAQLCAELGFDGIDINMGCPDRTIEKQGCGAAMMKDPDNAVAIIRAAKQGIMDSGRDIPLSVKTRVGYNRDEIDTWIPTLLRENIAALTLHARTRKELSEVPADWSRIARVVKLRDTIAPDTVILGNGDVQHLADGREKAKQTGCDGIMIGRAIFGNPWLFADQDTKTKNQEPNSKTSSPRFGSWDFGSWFLGLFTRDSYVTKKRYWLKNPANVPVAEKLRVMIEHTELFMELLGGHKNFAVMKKHYKAYATGFPGAKELRVQLMESKGLDEVRMIVAEFLGK